MNDVLVHGSVSLAGGFFSATYEERMNIQLDSDCIGNRFILTFSWMANYLINGLVIMVVYSEMFDAPGRFSSSNITTRMQ